MAAKKSARKGGLAEQRVAFLADYLRISGEHHRELEPRPGLLNFTERAARMAEWLRRERLEVIRAVTEIGISHGWDDPSVEDSPVIAVALREWQRAATEAQERTSMMMSFLKRARKLEQLERAKQVVEQRGEGALQRLAYGPNVPTHADLTRQVYKLRDALTREQPELERFLRDVGQTLGNWSLAGGALGIIDFVAERINQAVGAYDRWPTQQRRREEDRPMRDPIECARGVFASFKQAYDEQLGNNGVWWLHHDAEDEPYGLSSKEWRAGMAILVQKGLVKRMGQDERVLTEAGFEVCVHPETLDAHLGPRTGAVTSAASSVQHTTFHVQQMQNVQTGHGSVMHVTYSEVLKQLATDIEKSNTPPAEKSAMLDKINAVLSHPLTQTAITLAGGAVLPK